MSGFRFCAAASAQQLVEIDANHLGGHGMVGPALLDQRHEQRAGLLEGAQAPRLAGSGVGVALHGGVGGDDQHVAGARGGAGRGRAGLDDAQHRDRHGVLDGVERQGAGGVAGDHQEFCALLADQELRAFSGIAGDGAARFGAVGQPRRVAEESEARLGQAAE